MADDTNDDTNDETNDERADLPQEVSHLSSTGYNSFI